ncbi:MAG: DNA alkylation repair protein [Acidobacteriota bacterium]
MAKDREITPNEDQIIGAAVSEMRAFCQANADRAVVARYAKYFKEGYDGYGIDREIWEQHADRICEKYRGELGLGGLLRLGQVLFESGKYEEGSFAIRSITPFVRDFTAEVFKGVGVWLEKGVRNWAHTDVICSELLSPCLKSGAVDTSELAAWRSSESKWKRRAVPVALLGLAGRAETKPLLDFIRPLMMDSERVVHQGLGWFLREVWKKDPIPVEAFLLEWKDKAARLIFQYATEKMTSAQKERFRKTKS